MTYKSSNEFCVVKFLIAKENDWNNSAEQKSMFLKKEEFMWKTIHDDITQHVYSSEVCGMFYLCMPYVKPIDKEKRKSLIREKNELYKAFKSISDKGYIHEDAHRWEHIGYFQDKLRFIDLGPNAVRKIGEGESVEGWIDECLRELRYAAFEEEEE